MFKSWVPYGGNGLDQARPRAWDFHATRVIPSILSPCAQVPRHIVGDLIDTLLISRQEEVA